MRPTLRPKLSYSNVVASIALFVALGGAAVAAGLPKHSVGAKQIKKGAVTAAALRNGAVTSAKLASKSVTSGKLADKSVVNGKIGPSAVGPGNIGNGAVTTEKLQGGAVIASSIRNGAVTTNKLDNDAVTSAKLAPGAVTTAGLANGSVTAVKLGADVAPLLGTLRTGQTVRGVFDLGGDKESSVERAAQVFQFPLSGSPTAPESNILAANGTSAACPGLKGGSQQNPEAAPGQLCVYVVTTSPGYEHLAFDPGSVSRLGFGLKATFESGVGTEHYVQGFWAVTAP